MSISHKTPAELFLANSCERLMVLALDFLVITENLGVGEE